MSLDDEQIVIAFDGFEGVGVDQPAPTYNDRELASFDPIRDELGATVRLLESSSRTSASVWLRIYEQPTFECPGGPEGKARLSLDAVRMLRDQLSWFLDNHYMRT